MRSCLVFLFVPILLCSCKEDDSSTPNLYAASILAQFNPTDSFFYQIPEHKRTKFDSADAEIQKLSMRYLKLKSIEQGFDSIQIRIDYGCPVGFGDFLIILKNNTNKWEAEVCKITAPSTWKNPGDSIARITFKDSPKSGWVKFINRLFDLSILTLPDEKQLKDLHYSIPMDGCGVTVEIATKNAYRKYGYGNPEIYCDKFLEAKNILSILNLINEEFEVREKFRLKYMWPDDGKNVYRKDSASTLRVHKEIQLQDIKEDSSTFRR